MTANGTQIMKEEEKIQDDGTVSVQEIVEMPENNNGDVVPIQQDEQIISKLAQVNVAHSVEFRDAGGYMIDSQDWPCLFNLERERDRALRKESTDDKETVIKVITALKTSIPSDSRRKSWESDRIKQRGIMGNPKISITLRSVKLIIQSQLFIDVLRSLVSYDTDDLLEGERLELSEPYSVISHHLRELKAFMEENNNSLAKNVEKETNIEATTDDEISVNQKTYSHLSFVLDFVSTSLSDPITKELARYQCDPRMCTYRMLWFHFRPGHTVYVISDGTKDAYMIKEVDMGGCPISSTYEYLEPCRISLWNLNFNGQRLIRVQKDVMIRPFNGEKRILSLDVVPCEAWDASDNGALRKELEERGKKWIDHLSGRYIEYIGEPSESAGQLPKGRAYVDCASYYSQGNTCDFISMDPDSSDCKCSSCTSSKAIVRNTKWTQYNNIDFRTVHCSSDPNPSPQQIYLLCPRQLQGFTFSTRTWETFDVRFCEPCKVNRNPFAKLVMPEERKLMIKALVFKYTDPRFAGDNVQQVWGADFIKNKGEGQIFLLHGGPGVGKTFTAECIADFTGRPLLALTCGDIGTEEIQMEKKLRDWLKLAHKWGAVMLIDEADVFLEKRMDADLQRNSLVSVFLREIEYYQGILFLTSNRVGRFDDAFISRIHVVIHYRDLNNDHRRKIWNQFFDKLEAERGETMRVDNSAKQYVLQNSRMCQFKWNGREIRNAFQTAVALAEYRFISKSPLEKVEGEMAVLEDKDFEQICEMTMKFKEYLEQVNDGADEQERARQDRVRWVDDENDKK